MRILHTMDSGGLYGKEQMLLGLIKKQVEAGHTVNVIGFGNYDFYNAVEKLGVISFRIDTIKELYNFLKTYEYYDIIHTHDYKTGIIVASWYSVSKNKYSSVIRTVHGYTGFNKPLFSKIRAYEMVDKNMLRFNSATIAVSDEMGKDLNIPVIHNGIEPLYIPLSLDRDIIDFCESGIGKNDNAFVFCCMARLSPEKNLTALFQAISQIDNAKLLLFGDGPQMEELKTLAAWNPDKYFLAGFDRDAKYYLPYVTAYVQPSFTEGMPISVLEALSCGIPLITTHVGGMKVLHYAGVASRCYTDATLLEGALILFMKDKATRQKQAVAGIELFKERFSVDVMYREYNNLYEAQCASRK